MLSIQTNIASLYGQQNLSVNSNFQQTTISRLTSGYRINSAADDPAGMAIANALRNERTELSQGIRNGNDGVSQWGGIVESERSPFRAAHFISIQPGSG